MTPSQGSSPWPEFVRAAAGRCPREVSSEECYQRLSEVGLQYGPEFRGLVRLSVGAREAVGELHCPSGKSGPYLLPPNVLDSGLHALAMLSALEPGGSNGAAALPTAIRSIRVRGALKDRAFCHATLEASGDGGTQLGRVQLYDPQGALAVEVEGLVLRPAGDAIDASAWARDHAYQLTWEPRPRSGAPLSPAEPWLWIFPDEKSAREGVEALDMVGRADPVLAWPRGGAPKAIAGGVAVADGAPIEALLDSAQVERAVWLTGPLQPEEVALECERVLAVCQGAARSKSTRLLAVTYGAHDAKAPEPAQAAIWGLLRTFAREHPDRWGGLLDLPASARADTGRAVDFAMQSADAELAVFGDVVHQPRLARAAPEAAAPSFRADATYLVAGGTGGVGLKLSRWLVDRGARHLLLVGRREPSAEATSVIAELERRGARASAVQADVSRPEDVARALAEPHARGWPAVRGVFLLAAALADGVMHALDGQKLRVPLQAKVGGGWTLHRATASLPLDHFVLFSSIAAFGTAGQAGYAAGNAFLDALARYRKASGLPALSVGFGAFAEVGAAARLAQSGGRGAPGVEPMAPRLALDALGALLSAGEPHAVVGEFSWPAFAKDLPPGAARMYQELAQAQEKSAATSTAAADATAPSPGPSAAAAAVRHLPTWLRELPRPIRIEALVEHLQQQTSSLLGLPLEQAPLRDAPLMQSGLDSLMAVHLRNALTSTLEVGLSVTVVFDYPTIDLLADHLATALEPLPGSGETTKPSESLETLLNEIEQLPEEEVERRLRKGK